MHLFITKASMVVNQKYFIVLPNIWYFDIKGKWIRLWTCFSS